MPRALSLGLSFSRHFPEFILFTAKNSSEIFFNTLDIEKISSEQLKSTSLPSKKYLKGYFLYLQHRKNMLQAIKKYLWRY